MSLSKFSNVEVKGMVCVLPENHINIDDEIKYYENKKKLERNKKILGLGTRHVVPDGVTGIDLCKKAAEVLIERLGIDKEEIDTLIVASINHDYLGNSDACIIQGELGFSEECACFDMSGLGCTDAIYSLWVGHSLVESGASKKCLVLEGSLSSQITDPRNRNSNMLFGDAGSAILLERTDKDNPSYFHLESRGKDWKKIVSPAGGFKFPIREDIIDIEIKDPEGNPIRLWDSTMQGTEIFKFAIENAPKSINKILTFAEKSKEDIDFFAIHQANGQIVRTVINHSRVPKDKASAETFTKFGNCGGTSVLVNYCDQMKGKENENVLLIAFGVGLSTSSVVLNLKDSFNEGIYFYQTPEKVQTRSEMIQEWTNFLERKN